VVATPRRPSRQLFAAFVILLALWTARSFVVSLTWAVLIALTLWPLYCRLAPRESQRRGVAAPLVFTLLSALIVLVPIAFVLAMAGQEAQTVAQWIQQVQQIGLPVPDWVVRVPLLGQSGESWWRAHLADPAQAAEMLKGLDLGSLAAWSQSIGAEITHRLLLALVTFMALFFLFRDGDRLADRVLTLVDRILGDPGDRLAGKLAGTVRGTVNGTVLVAVGEGLLITVGYALTGVPHPILFGLFTIACAMLPMGAWLAFGAASLVLLVQGGGVLWAAILFAWGAAVMLIGDNFVQPALIGGAARLPFLWTLIGILGGLETFGLVGLFVGPVIMAAFLTIWREWLTPTSADAAGTGDAVPGRPG
jgi:predicted PurR-regulated permease PerM